MKNINYKIGIGIPIHKRPRVERTQLFTYVNLGFVYVVKFNK